MKFSTREDIDAPIDTVWAAVSDFRGFEHAALRTGAEVRRLADGDAGLGTAWMARFRHRGIERTLECMVSGYEPPRRLEADSHSGGLDGFLTVELVPLRDGMTRMLLSFELRPRNLPGRMLLRTLQLAKGRLTMRFRSAVRRFAAGIPRSLA